VTAELKVTSDVLPGMAATVTIPQEEVVDTVILNKDALSFARDNSAYVLMYDEQQVLQQIPVTIGLDNDNYVEITSGLKAGDTVYAQANANGGAGNIFSMMFSNFGGGGNTRNNQNNRNNRNNGGFGGMPGGR